MNRGYPPSGVPGNSVPPVGPTPVPVPPPPVTGGPSPVAPVPPPSAMGPMPPQPGPGMRPPDRPMMQHSGPPPTRQYPNSAPVYQVFLFIYFIEHICTNIVWVLFVLPSALVAK